MAWQAGLRTGDFLIEVRAAAIIKSFCCSCVCNSVTERWSDTLTELKFLDEFCLVTRVENVGFVVWFLVHFTSVLLVVMLAVGHATLLIKGFAYTQSSLCLCVNKQSVYSMCCIHLFVPSFDWAYSAKSSERKFGLIVQTFSIRPHSV